ncbi:hypothetical protein CLV99_3953 [Sphingobacterium yanglingense]|uniref:Uncharacterized protein n=1 Tax=Sphingobacterium yanglingense TaxID=1437280 RepID=A0A4R6WE72_9SPHI|nr:hypothetical protein CLV99_3953 [Sphingobacterium yanglingense]
MLLEFILTPSLFICKTTFFRVQVKALNSAYVYDVFCRYTIQF